MISGGREKYMNSPKTKGGGWLQENIKKRIAGTKML